MEYITLEEKVKESFFLAKDEEGKPHPEETAKMWIREFWITAIGCIAIGLLVLSGSIQQLVSGFRHYSFIDWFKVGFGIFLFFLFFAMVGVFYYYTKKMEKKGRLFPLDQEKTIERAKEYIQHYEFLLKEANIIDEKWKQITA